MSQSLSNNYLHLVFSTKDRRAYLSDAIRNELHSYMATVLQNLQSPALLINSVEDHIHILFRLHPSHAQSKVIGKIKTSTSAWLKTKGEGLKFFSWQLGYGSFSVSESNIPAVKQYIADQQEHHKTMTYQGELRRILEKHKMEYDERYLWD